MTGDDPAAAESRRLEDLWGGDFGDDYVDRNTAFDHRAPFWRDRMTQLSPGRVLEVGSNVGGNLQWIAEAVPPTCVYGVDVNEKALAELTRRVPGVNALWSPARELPFRDGWFDLVFTMGVLIHQPEATLPLVMAEMVRCSRRWVLCGEYHAEDTVEVPYRGQEGALFKRDYGRLFLELFPDLTLRDQGFLGRDDGWDDVTWWVLEKP
jgi:pseudaminic acid biosynthesis-associated methylase